MVNNDYNFGFSGCCVTGGPVYSIVGTLPPGITLKPFGALSGTPTTAGRYTFEVRATDPSNAANYGSRIWTLNVSPLQVSTPVPTGTTGTSYSTGFTASGGSGTLSWALTGGSLPPGVTLLANGTLSGTPTSGGTFNFNFTVTDAAGNSYTGGSSMQVYAAGTTPAPSIEGGMGTVPIGAVQSGLTPSGGNGTYSWSVAYGSLPPGLAVRTDPAPWFSPSTTAGVIGVATTPGNYPFTLALTSGGKTAYRYFPATITALTVKDLYQLPDAFAGNPYTYTLTALNGAGPVTWTIDSGLPPGMNLSSAGILSGTPTTAGAYSVNFHISDGVDTVYRNEYVNVYAVQITSPGMLPNATYQSAYSYTFSASGGAGSYTWTSNGLPPGLALTSAGVLSGILNWGPGKYSFTLTATDSNRVSYTKSMALAIVGAPPTLPALAGPSFLSDCVYGVPCNRSFWVYNGGSAPFSYMVTGLPSGMGYRWGSGVTSSYINVGDVEIWGTPTATGDFDVQVKVADSNGAVATQVFPLHVATISRDGSDGLPGGTRGTPYSKLLRVIGGTQPYTVQMLGGKLPAGVTLSGQTVAGTPLENGSFSMIFRYTDAAGAKLEQQEGFYVGGGTSTLNINQNYELGTVTVNQFYSNQLSACCTINYTWTAAGGSWPPGLTLSSSGLLSGTPTTPGTYTFMAQVADAANSANVGLRQFVLTVTPLALTTSTTLPYGNVGTVYSQTLAVSGASGALNWVLDLGNHLPPGLVLNATTGAITGTPTSTGFYSFWIVATDASGNTLRRNFSLTIYTAGGYPPLNLPLGPNLGPWLNGAQRIQLQATGGVPPYHYSLTPGATPHPRHAGAGRRSAAGLVPDDGDGRLHRPDHDGGHVFDVGPCDRQRVEHI